jgi:hypothetical protein
VRLLQSLSRAMRARARAVSVVVSLLAAVAASSLQHPEEMLASLTIKRTDSGISVHAGGLADSAAYRLLTSVVHRASSTLLLERSWRNLTVPPGDSTAVRLVTLPADTTGMIRVEAELQDMFLGLSADEALLARINTVVEFLPASACSFAVSLEGKRCPQIDEWSGPADQTSCRQACCSQALASGTCFAWSWSSSGKGHCYHGFQQHLDVASQCVDDPSYTGELGLQGNLWDGQNAAAACNLNGVCPTRKVATWSASARACVRSLSSRYCASARISYQMLCMHEAVP